MIKDHQIGVYIIRNKITKEYYIGSSRNLKVRFARHKKELRANTHHNVKLQKLYNAYKMQDFEFKVVKYFKTITEARELENKLIKKYKDSQKCLNLGLQAVGGDNLTKNPNKKEIVNKIRKGLLEKTSSMTKEERKLKWGRAGSENGMFGKHHSQKTKELISKANLGKSRGLGIKKSAQGRANIKKAAIKRVKDKDYVNPFTGKHHSTKTKQELSKKAKERYLNGKLPGNARKVLVGKVIYSSVTEAARNLNITPAMVIYRIKSKKYDYKYLN